MLITGPHHPVTIVADACNNLGEMFCLRVNKSSIRPAYFEKQHDRWIATTWGQFYDRASQVAAGLIEMGYEPGERVAILGPTQGQWAIYDMGAQLAGLVSMGIYPRQSPEGLRYLLEHSEARVLFVDEERELKNALKAAQDLSSLDAFVPWSEHLAGTMAEQEPKILSPRKFCRETLAPEELQPRLTARGRDHTAVLIYTSGTTGPPKGAMISHGNILSLLGAEADLSDFYEDDLSLSFLPMAHAAERILAFYGRVNTGMCTAYASSIPAVLDEVREVKPTIFGSVPRLFEKAYSKIQSEVERKPPVAQKVFAWADSVGRRHVRERLAGRRPGSILELQYRLASRLVFSKIREAFGGRVRVCLSGAAPISVEILEFFWAAGLPIYECYGQTEATVVTHANREGRVKLGTVGRPVGSIECRIADDGEVLIRGPYVFQGYLKNPEASAQTVVDGWLRTGDIGTIDEQGYLKITDRKKHIIITAGGKNLTPANIEKAIKGQDSLISHVHPHGDQRPYVSALIAPSPLETLDWGVERGLVSSAELAARTRELLQNPTGRSAALEQAMSGVVAHPEFQKRIQAAVRRGNERLAKVERVRRFHILDRDFSQEHGEMTPTMKLRRKSVETSYAETFDRIYGENDFALQP